MPENNTLLERSKLRECNLRQAITAKYFVTKKGWRNNFVQK